MDNNVINATNPNDNYNNKTNTFNLVIGIATLLIALLGATFAYFSATARSEENDVTVKSAYVSISYHGGTQVKATNLIPSSLTVALNKYMKEQTPLVEGDSIIDYDEYYSENVSDRKCIDAKGKEVCSVYQFSVRSEGVEGKDTEIVASLKINKNEFENLSYIMYKVNLEEENGVPRVDKYGFDIVDLPDLNSPASGYTPVGSFNEVEDPNKPFEDQTKFAKFRAPFDGPPNMEGHVEKIYPVACLFGEKDPALFEGEVPGEDDTHRCLSTSIRNNEKHTYQLVIWLNETGKVQNEQGLSFEGTVSVEVSGGSGEGNSDYDDGKITGQLDSN